MPNFGSGEVGWTGVSEYTTTHRLSLDGGISRRLFFFLQRRQVDS